ncbi:MAG TPA: M91 family zinc metallopeptidase [Pyrinomonadaceae bacterium]|nr:M91 family zinc metallopeptidase [Pyrinomonadaceae bacterium]
MADNFEEQYLLFLVPYDQVGIFYVTPPGRPDLPANVPAHHDPFPNGDAWTTAVRGDITKIANTKVGSLLLRSIRYHGQAITVRPKDMDYCNSGTLEGDTISHGGGVTVGTGSDIVFNPDTYQVGSKCEAKSLAMGGFHVESNEVLLHELVHAFRHVSGKDGIKPLAKGLSFYGNNEEFNAVLVQGIYASERKKPVRSSHFHHFEIDKELNSSMRFFKTGEETFTWVEKFCQQNPGFTKALAEIDVPFNPINSYYYDREQVKNLGKSATAKRRDKFMPMAKMVVDFLKKEFN